MRKPIAFLSALGLVAIMAASPASAIPITYIEKATATGSLGGTSFSSVTITLTMRPCPTRRSPTGALATSAMG